MRLLAISPLFEDSNAHRTSAQFRSNTEANHRRFRVLSPVTTCGFDGGGGGGQLDAGGKSVAALWHRNVA